MKCKLVRDAVYGPSSGRPGQTAHAGTILDVPEAWKLVRMGLATPADEECAFKAARTPEQLRAAQYASLRAERGIIPEDFAAYDAGALIGYYPDGSWIPGPNFEDWNWQQTKAESPLIIED